MQIHQTELMVVVNHKNNLNFENMVNEEQGRKGNCNCLWNKMNYPGICCMPLGEH